MVWFWLWRNCSGLNQTSTRRYNGLDFKIQPVVRDPAFWGHSTYALKNVYPRYKRVSPGIFIFSRSFSYSPTHQQTNLAYEEERVEHNQCVSSTVYPSIDVFLLSWLFLCVPDDASRKIFFFSVKSRSLFNIYRVLDIPGRSPSDATGLHHYPLDFLTVAYAWEHLSDTTNLSYQPAGQEMPSVL